jgi:pimeloyl-ACP methyl ester carboxylesterase
MVKIIDVLGFPHAYELSAPTESPVALVFVHGWLLSRAYWQPVIEQLASDYQCLTYDLRGFGDSQRQVDPAHRAQAIAPVSTPSQARSEAQSLTQPVSQAMTQTIALSSISEKATLSEKATMGVSESVNADANWVDRSLDRANTVAASIPDSYTPAAYAQDLVALLRQLNIRRAWLIGHSLGGSIALWAADQAPDTVVGVTCINAGGGIYLKEEFERFRGAGAQLVKFRPRWLSYFPFLDLALTRMSVARPIDRRWGKQRLVDLLVAQPEAALGTLLDSTTEAEVHRLPQVVARLQQPIHFVAGQNDTVMEPKYVHHLASFHASFQCCGNNVSEISNCGHLAMIEQPEATAHEIRSILERHDCI